MNDTEQPDAPNRRGNSDAPRWANSGTAPPVPDSGRVITTAALEVAARAQYEAEWEKMQSGKQWGDLPAFMQQPYLLDAELVLAAAAPLIVREFAEHLRRPEAIERAVEALNLLDCGAAPEGVYIDQAEAVIAALLDQHTGEAQ